jgi:hypothetical protein
MFRCVASAAFGDEAANELSRQATDPTASLMAFNFLGEYSADFYGPSLAKSNGSSVSGRGKQ